MMRALAFVLMCLLALAALAASNRAQPLVVEAHAPGHWQFNQADYSDCRVVHLAPIEPRQHGDNFYPRRSDTA